MKRESRYDEKEKLIQSHHLNIKTFPQTPLDCVIQLSAFYIVYMRIWKTPHYTIDNSCLMKMLRFCISQMSFFMDFIIIAANSCCCCMDYTRDTTPSNQEKRTLYKTLTFRTFISIPTEKNCTHFRQSTLFRQYKINIYFCNDKNHNPYIHKKVKKKFNEIKMKVCNTRKKIKKVII